MIKKIWFEKEKQGYNVQAQDDRYLICTKPFNPKKTVLYTIVDLKENIRGTDNLVFGFGYETKEECENALEMIQSDEMEISHRNRIALKIRKMVKDE